MSRGSQTSHAERLGELGRQLRRFQRLGAAYYRAAAARAGLAATDLEVIASLESTGPATAGQLAERTGLTTGAITGLLNRLEEAGLVRRERDADDARRVIVRLAPDTDGARTTNAIFGSMGQAWDDLLATYDDDRLAVLLEALERANDLTEREIDQLRAAPSNAGDVVSAPLDHLEQGQLVVSSGIARLTVRAGAAPHTLYEARFEGTPPDVKAKDGVVTIRYPRRLGLLGWRKVAAEVQLSAAITWRIAIQGGAADVTAELGGLDLAGLEVKGGMSTSRLELPTPTGTVPIRISGGASQVTVRRPAGVAARVHLKGWASEFVFDDQTFSAVGNDVRLQSPDYDTADRRYDIEVASSVSMVTITAG